VHGHRRFDAYVPEVERVARLDLVDVREALPPEQTAEAARHDDRDAPPETTERRQVEVVVMSVREEHRVDVGEPLGG
jgi:hypothetical protein